MKVLKSRQGPEAWLADLEYHRLILQVIRECNPALANEFVQHCIKRFAVSAYSVWENVGGSVEAHHRGRPTSVRRGKQDA
jgi:hypothetical protein